MKDSADQDEQLDEVLLEYETAVDAGSDPCPEELIVRHPDLAAALSDYFLNKRTVAQVVRPLLPPTLLAPLHSIAPGTRIGNYEILEELGRGGQGVVFRARDLLLPRSVALKVIRDHTLADEATRRRFRTEAEKTASLDHPNIVKVYEVNESATLDGEPLPYFAMSLIAGPTLDKVLRQQPLPGRQAAAILILLAEAVQHAHNRGIIHRDLKPANILLNCEGSQSPKTNGGDSSHALAGFTPYITDFGLARPVISNGGLTQPGAIVGTVSYMAPEQAAGRCDITIAVDVYGLGAILYEMLTGKPPFEGDNTLDLLLRVRTEEPRRPRLLNPKIDRDLETICRKCLESEASRRYTSAQAMADDLTHFLRGEPLLVRPTSRRERLVKWARRKPGIAVLLATLLALVGAGVFASVWVAVAWERSADQAVARLYVNQIVLAQIHLSARHFDRAEMVLSQCAPRLRRWEWYYLAQLCQRERITLGPDHFGPILAFTFSSDGSRIATASRDGMLRVWNADTGEVLHAWPSRSSEIESLCFTGDGKYLLTAAQDNVVTLWSTDTDMPLQEIPDGGSLVAAPGTGTLVASLAWDKKVKVWEVVESKSGAQLRLQFTLPEERVKLLSLAFSRDGRYLAVGSFSSTIKVWNLKPPTGGPAFTSLPDMEHDKSLRITAVRSLCFNREGTMLASGSMRPGLWEVATGKSLRSLSGAGDMLCNSIGCSADARYIVATSTSGQVHLWDMSTGRTLLSPLRGGPPVRQTAFSPRPGAHLALVRGSRVTLENLDLGSRKESRILETQEKNKLASSRPPLQALAWAPDGNRLATRAVNGIYLWDTAVLAAARCARLEAQPDLHAGVSFSADGRRLVSGTGPPGLAAWEVASGQQCDLRIAIQRAWSVAFSKEGGLLAVVDGSNQVRLWDFATGKELDPIGDLLGAVLGVAFSPDGQRLGVCGESGLLQVHRVRTRKKLFECTGHRHPVTCVAFSPDGNRLASGGSDGTVRLWNAKDGKGTEPLDGHSGQVTQVAFSPTSDRVASASHDGTVRLWDVGVGQEVLTLNGHEGPVTGVAFRPGNGWLLASCGHDGCVRIWDGTPPGEKQP